ncbi:hypothetical protein LSAT2_027112 [Lamellibrachia satsuma]|nr:hypothetical protein LSAT2_027112 [Lamellibrachia satsuma]
MTSKANWPYVINMGNSIIGVTVLAMPFCFKQCGVLLGMSLLIGSSCLTYLSCSLLVKAAHTSRKRSYEFLAFHSFGSAGKLAVEFSIIGLLIGTCIAFYVIIGDLGPAIISKMTGLENTSGLRTSLMVILALCVVLPLGLLRDLHSLSNVSAISLSFYIIFVAEVCSAALPNLWSGVWVTKVVYWNPEGVFRCLPIFSLAFACQTQLFLMYDSLPEPSLKRMSIITKRAIGLSASVYLLVGYFGYVAFCDEDISGDILMNFRPTIFSESVKLGFVLSVAISFPLVIFPCRAALYTLIYAQEGGSHDHLGGPMPIPETKFKIMTVAIVIATLIVGIKVPNIEFVLAITGATMGSMISFIFPAIMFISVMSISHSKFVAQMVLFIGVTVLLASTYVTLNGVDNAALAQESVVKIAKSADELAKPPLELPTPLTPANKESVDVNKLENKRAGDDVIKDVPVAKASMKPETKDEEKEKKKDEKRQEPPNPHAPDTGEQKNVGTGEVGGEKKGNADGVKKQDVGVKGTEKEATKGAQKKVAEKVEVKSGKTENRKDVDKKKDTNAEAKILLKELKVQHAVQEKLIEQQKEIIQELKQHQKEAHQEKPAGAAEQQPAQEQYSKYQYSNNNSKYHYNSKYQYNNSKFQCNNNQYSNNNNKYHYNSNNSKYQYSNNNSNYQYSNSSKYLYSNNSKYQYSNNSKYQYSNNSSKYLYSNNSSKCQFSNNSSKYQFSNNSRYPYNSKYQYSSNNSKYQYSSNNSKYQYSSYNSKYQYSSNNSKYQYSSNNSKYQYSSNNSKYQYSSKNSKYSNKCQCSRKCQCSNNNSKYQFSNNNSKYQCSSNNSSKYQFNNNKFHSNLIHRTL